MDIWDQSVAPFKVVHGTVDDASRSSEGGIKFNLVGIRPGLELKERNIDYNTQTF